MRSIHCIRVAAAVLALALPASLAAAWQSRTANSGMSAPSSFTIYVRGIPIGNELIAVARNGDGWTINGSGRLGAPLNVVTRQLTVHYDPNWKAVSLTIDATVRNQPYALRSTVKGNTIVNELIDGAQPVNTTAMTDAELLLPTSFFAPYEALAARVRAAAKGSKLSAFAAPQLAFTVEVGDSTSERIQTASEFIDTRHTRLTFTAPNMTPVEVELWADGNGRLLRFHIPSQFLEVVREDIASVAARNVPISRPNDEQVRVPSTGFNLAGTLAKPMRSDAAPLPAVVFVAGSGPTDRDENTFGIPILGQLAGAVADAGFITLRYDKRGVGQSGGRLESGALSDLAEDLRSAVKLLARRKDVDPKRIAVVGHSEGGAVALLAAARDKGIAAVGLLAANGVTGAELILEQQQHVLGRLNLGPEENQRRVELQKRINNAVITGAGWDKLPAEIRRQTDNLEFQSILMNDPAKVMPDVRQPVLILQGALDTQVAPSNADRLEALARKRKNSPAVEVTKIPGVNHLLVPAQTGEVEEYGALKDRQVSPAVSDALIAWLRKTLRY
jgi:pimeloyl-ACP methyl ester carboxylesterase